jgi:hypothetical protein
VNRFAVFAITIPVFICVDRRSSAVKDFLVFSLDRGLHVSHKELLPAHLFVQKLRLKNDLRAVFSACFLAVRKSTAFRVPIGHGARFLFLISCIAWNFESQ